MLYKKNEAMDYIFSDQTTLAVYDPESGDTHFFDETGIDILNLLEKPKNVDSLLAELSKIYNASPDDMREDVIIFIMEVVAKKVVLEI